MERAIEIARDLAAHYKSIKVRRVSVDGDGVVLVIDGRVKLARVAKRIVDRYAEIYWVNINDCWIFTRETLKWLEYDNDSDSTLQKGLPN